MQLDITSGRKSMLLAAGVMVAGMLLATTAMFRQSATVDEYAALPNGLTVLKSGWFQIDAGEPPLTKVLPAAPLLLTDARLDTAQLRHARTSWECGILFAAENAGSYHKYFVIGRSVSLFVLMLTYLLSYGYARSLYGDTGALLAGCFIFLCPNLMAHGALTTPDIYLTAAIVGSLWALDWLLRDANWRSAMVLGTAVGVATLCKFTGLVLFVIFPLIVLLLFLGQRLWTSAEAASSLVVRRRTWLWGLAAIGVGIFVINLGYLFHGSCTMLGYYEFATWPFQLVQRMLPRWLPVPLPYYFVHGMDSQLSEQGYVAYLLGQFNNSGFLHYYVVGLLVKTPLPTILLCLLAYACDWRIKRREWPALITVAILLCIFSLARHKNIGVRYVLFFFPLAGMWIGRLATSPAWNSSGKRGALAVAVSLGAISLLARDIAVWPNYLSYFNLACGGSSQGHKILLDSNLDWGQGLIALREYMQQEKIDSVDLAYFGRVRPELYGIRYRFLGTRPMGRYVAISANLLWGRMYFINGSGVWPPNPDTFAQLRPLRPKAVLGETIYIYDMQEVSGAPHSPP